MQHSLNEVHTVLLRASLGAGLATGLAEDVARAGELLCAIGLDGVGACLSAFRGGMDVPAVPEYVDDIAIFPAAQTAICGPSVIDLLAAGRIASARLLVTDSPLLMVGLAAVGATDQNLEFLLSFESGTTLAHRGGLDIEGMLPLPGTDMGVASRPINNRKAANPAFPTGVSVAEVSWLEASMLAAKTYVPASEASRVRGAGASTSDND